MDVVDLVREAGVVGAGGAGFPTHVKIKCRAEVVIANGAECEPMLRIDQQLMEHYSDAIVRGMEAVMGVTGASRGVICLKAHYYNAVDAMEKAIAGKPGLSLHLMKSYYPAGDEQQMVYDVTGQVVPTGALPLDVGAVVNNVATFINIANALDGKPVTDKHVTVGGEVAHPVTLRIPIGTSYRALIDAAGGPTSAHGYTLIIGGPAMGALCNDWDAPVTKTTGGVLVFRTNHKLISRKTPNTEEEIRMAKAVCCQCNMCTLMCPRHALGLAVEPHKAMRAAAMGQGALLGDPNGMISCCDCGICTYYACNFGLKPSRMMQNMKQGLAQQGYKPRKEVKGSPNKNLEMTRIPVKRLIMRLGISDYDVLAPLDERDLGIGSVTIPLRQHIGRPSVPVVSKGERVQKGALIADIPENSLGAKIHASIDGTVADVTDQAIVIQA